MSSLVACRQGFVSRRCVYLLFSVVFHINNSLPLLFTDLAAPHHHHNPPCASSSFISPFCFFPSFLCILSLCSTTFCSSRNPTACVSGYSSIIFCYNTFFSFFSFVPLIVLLNRRRAHRRQIRGLTQHYFAGDVLPSSRMPQSKQQGLIALKEPCPRILFMSCLLSPW